MNRFPFDEIENILDDAEEDARINGWLEAYNNGLKRLDGRADALTLAFWGQRYDRQADSLERADSRRAASSPRAVLCG
jgi:hypothetical protein